jgi:hypothetical protein
MTTKRKDLESIGVDSKRSRLDLGWSDGLTLDMKPLLVDMTDEEAFRGIDMPEKIRSDYPVIMPTRASVFNWYGEDDIQQRMGGEKERMFYDEVRKSQEAFYPVQAETKRMYEMMWGGDEEGMKTAVAYMVKNKANDFQVYKKAQALHDKVKDHVQDTRFRHDIAHDLPFTIEEMDDMLFEYV